MRAVFAAVAAVAGVAASSVGAQPPKDARLAVATNCYVPRLDQRPTVETGAAGVCALASARWHSTRVWPDGHVDTDQGRGAGPAPVVRVRRGEVVRFRYLLRLDWFKRLTLRYGRNHVELTPAHVVPWRVPASGRYRVVLTITSEAILPSGDRVTSQSEHSVVFVAARRGQTTTRASR